MSKRGAEYNNAAVAKRPANCPSYYNVGLVSNQEELDAKVLLIQNQNLAAKNEFLQTEVKDFKSKYHNSKKAFEIHDITISTVGRIWDNVSLICSYVISVL